MCLHTEAFKSNERSREWQTTAYNEICRLMMEKIVNNGPKRERNKKCRLKLRHNFHLLLINPFLF